MDMGKWAVVIDQFITILFASNYLKDTITFISHRLLETVTCSFPLSSISTNPKYLIIYKSELWRPLVPGLTL